jgi:proline iminopeptidase
MRDGEGDMISITRRGTLGAGAALAAGCAQPAQEQPREGRIAVPGGEIVWRRFGDGPKTPLLAIHGGPGFPSDYLDTLAPLGNERSVYLWDQLGCGRSDRPTDPSLWNIPRFVEEMHAVRTGLGLTRLHILGQSWGTCLATDYLLTKGLDGVASVTLAGPVMSARRYLADVRPMISEVSAEHQAVIAEAERTQVYDSPAYLAATEAFYALHITRSLSPETRVLWDRTVAGAGLDTYVAMNGPSEFSFNGSLQSYEREADLPRLQLPVLFLSGEFDTCTPDAARHFASQTPNAEVAVIPGAGHVTTLDNPDATNAAVRAFIEAHDA